MLAEALVAVEVQDKMKAAAVNDPSLSMSASDILGSNAFQVRMVSRVGIDACVVDALVQRSWETCLSSASSRTGRGAASASC